ncbi:MAG: hypothetical protein A4S17_02660 [Proteobacteria bacterium HN_bin10]|nr:MAG: hypothetical protein A4S17_02660 [Proteobacteria bacterium HN_bin10]
MNHHRAQYVKADIRDTAMFQAVAERYKNWLRPGEGAVADLADLACSPDGKTLAASATVCDALEGMPTTRIALIELETGKIDLVEGGSNSDRLPRWSPDGTQLAFLSDRENAFIYRLRILDMESGKTRDTVGLEGWIEYHHWSPDGRQILLGVAGYGVDLAGAQGGFALKQSEKDKPAWLPEVEERIALDSGRSAWVYDVEADRARRVSPQGVNVWEAVWLGPNVIAGVCSDNAGEEAWYSANVRSFSIDGDAARVLYTPRDQLGWLSASPSGNNLAVVEAVCSDRTIVAGQLLILSAQSGEVTVANTGQCDAVSTAWRDDRTVLITGARAFANLVLIYDTASNTPAELWSSETETPSGVRFAEAAGCGPQRDAVVLMREGWFTPPTVLRVIGDVQEEVLTIVEPVTATALSELGSAEAVRWSAPDGMEICGWLLRPKGSGPHPLVVEIHGGPVWFYRPRYIGKSILDQSLLAEGFAVLLVNPRGSSGRGQEFARHVFGDMGGADTLDFTSGVEALIAKGIADPARIGVTGGSYGGFMSAWLITQSDLFAAAVPVVPVTNWVSEHLTCHIGHFCEMFLADDIDNPNGKYFTRSPIHFAENASAPTLTICGALDKNTPPGQAIEFHHALLRHDVDSVLVTYPLEGHGPRRMPTTFDYVTRVVSWFSMHMPIERRI